MRIGIDIDGVLVDTTTFMITYGRKFFEHNPNVNVVNVGGYDIDEIFDVPVSISDAFWDTYLPFYVSSYPARKEAASVIENLVTQGHEIIIITARYLSTEQTRRGEKMRNCVKQWLHDNHIIYHEIAFTPEGKLPCCKEKHIDVMIEDKSENIEFIATELPVICYDHGYNDSVVGKNIIHCKDWKEIEDVLKKW